MPRPARAISFPSPITMTISTITPHASMTGTARGFGPKRDIVGGWAKAARARGLKFGVSNHSAHAWHWFQTAYGYDPEGPSAGERYDAFRLTKYDGKGKWWEGLDPQELIWRRGHANARGHRIAQGCQRLSCRP